MIRFLKLIISSLLLFMISNSTLACGHPPVIEKPKVWLTNHGIDPVTGLNNLWLGVEIDPQLFPISQPTLCTCGIGIGGVGLPFIPSLNVTSAKLAVTNTVTHAMDPLAEFAFSSDAAITSDAAANALLPNQQWFGFSVLVNSVVQPVYQANEVLKLWFTLEIAPSDITAFTIATTNQLMGFTIGGSPNDPTHAPVQFTAQIPLPASILLFINALLLLGWFSRKRLTT